MSTPRIRPIQEKDNPLVAKILRKVLEDLNVPKVGTAYADPALDHMYQNYQEDGSMYFILEYQGTIMGGAGIAPLRGHDGNVCELQKMYFLPKARGHGWGSLMINRCLNIAREFGYDQCYIETMDSMKVAQKLYSKYGFEHLEGPMGDTGHYSCGVHMILNL